MNYNPTLFLVVSIKGNDKIVLIVRNLTVSENVGTMYLNGYCNVEIEFAEKKDSSLYSLGTFYSNIVENNQKVKYTHGKRVLEALYSCLLQFNNTTRKNLKREEIEDLKKKIDYDYKSLPPKGAYIDYNQMKRKSPIDTTLYNITEARNSKKIVTYKINFKKHLNP